MNIQHSMRNDSWRTPQHVVDLVRRVLGVIELDPASSEQANRTVCAEQYYTRQDDALSFDWQTGCSIYLNPPGGRKGRDSMTRLFWRKLMAERERGFKHAIFAMFSVEGLQTTQGDVPPAMSFPLCVPSKRIRWVHPTEDKAAPSHSNAFVYVPGSMDQTSCFLSVFSELGCCKP